MKQLSAASTFEDYVKAVSEIVTERGRTIFRALTGKETLPQYEVADPKGDALSDLKERLSKAHPQLDENTVARMADLIEFNNYLVDHEQLKSDYTDKLTKNRTDYAHKITTQEKESLHNPLDWTRWWYWVILYFVIAIGFGINRALMRNPSFDQAKLVDPGLFIEFQKSSAIP